MKILQINSVCGTGSTGKIAVEISDFLNEKGVQNYIAYGLGETERKNTFKISNFFDSHLHSFISRKFCMQGYGSHLCTMRLVKYIKKIKPDIVHLHNIHGHYLNFGILFRYLNSTDIAVVWTFHDCWPFTGKCAHYIHAGCGKWQTHCSRCPLLKTYPDSERDRSEKNYTDKKALFAANKNLHITTVSKWLCSQAEQSFFKGHDIRCIYNGINTDIFTPRQSNWREKHNLQDKFVILGVASVWSSRKGLDEFVELSKRIDPDTRIVLVGTNDEQASVLPENVIGIKNTKNQNELAEIYSCADVFLNLSAEETFGLVVAEAMACGTPSIVYNATACPEVLAEDCGYVVEPHDLDAVYEKIQTIKANGKDIYSQSAIKRVKENFTKQKMLNEFWNLYNSITDKHKI